MPRKLHTTENDWRKCPKCGTWFTGRPNKNFCTEFCGKMYRYETKYRFSRNQGGKPVELITIQMVQREDAKKHSAPAPRPDNTQRCGCGKHLYSYEVPLKKCLSCVKQSIMQTREFCVQEGQTA